MKIVEYEIIHAHYFSYKGSKPTEKKWSFNLKIQQNGANTFKVYYSKVLTECLFNLNRFRAQKILYPLPPPDFTYQFQEGNLTIVEKKAVLIQLNYLKSIDNQQVRKEVAQEFQQELDYLLDDEAVLNEELLREIRFIHELGTIPIELGTQLLSQHRFKPGRGSVNWDGTVLSGDEKKFVKQIDWTETGSFKVLKTSLENPMEIKYDQLYGASVWLSHPHKRAKLSEILNRFLQTDLEIGDYNHVSLNRDRRILSRHDNHLNHLLQENRIHSEFMHRATKLEMKCLKNSTVSTNESFQR